MGETHDESRATEPLRVGLVADAEGLQLLGPALAGSPLQVVALGGQRAAEDVSGAAWYDDVRVMLAQADLEGLVLATSTRAAVELGEMAADHELPVWRLPPLARNFAEATEIVSRRRQRGLCYRVASWWEAIGDDLSSALQQDNGVKPAFTHIRVCAAGPSVQSWRASATDAPGGVLATDAYNMLEALVAVRNLPETVSACAARVRRRAGEPPRETEDVASAILRYEAGRAAAIYAAWDVSPAEQITAHHGPELTVILEPDRVATYAATGELLAERRLTPADFLKRELQHFATAARQPTAENTDDLTLQRHLAVTALLQAIYLAARTDQPESPLKLYEVQGWPQPRW